MIIGDGLLGRNLKKIDRDGYLFFASGVSNSKTTDETEFQTEKKLLLQTIESYPEKKIIYFGTYSVLDTSVSSFPYIRHKLEMESIVKRMCNSYLLIRTSNIYGKGGNPNTIINFIINCIENDIEFDVWENAYRNILSVDHFVQMLDYAITKGELNKTLYIVNTVEYSIIDIVRTCEKIIGKKSITKMKALGSKFDYDKSFSDIAFSELMINKDHYLYNLIKTYYE